MAGKRRILCRASILFVVLTSIPATGAPVAWRIGAESGLVEGEAREVFYSTSPDRYRVSELTWDISQVWIAGVRVEADITGKVSACVRHSIALSRGTGEMTDVDWTERGAPWSDRSCGAARVLDGSVLDVHLAVELVERDALRLRGLLGYRGNEWSWHDWGGTFVYSSPGGFRDMAGRFPPGVGIRYRQSTDMPYIGLDLASDGRDFGFRAEVLYSPLVSGRNSDEHVLRGFSTSGSFSGGFGMLLRAVAEWRMREDLSFVAAAGYEKVDEIEGDNSIYGYEGSSFFVPNGAGLSHEALSATVGVAWRP